MLTAESSRDINQAARSAAKYLKELGFEIPHAKALDLVARTLGKPHHMAAQAGLPQGSQAAVALPSAPLELTTSRITAEESWKRYASRSQLVPDEGPAPDPEKAMTAHSAYVRGWEEALAAAAVEGAMRKHAFFGADLQPVDGDVLPGIGTRVMAHYARPDEWREQTVVGYYVWGDLRGEKHLHRVFVRLRDDEGWLSARMLCDLLPVAGDIKDVKLAPHDPGCAVHAGPPGRYPCTCGVTPAATPAPAPKAGAAVAAAPVPHATRTPKDYAIEHAGYLANAATHLLKCINAEDSARMRHEERDTKRTGEALDKTMDLRGEAFRSLRECVYEFEKRRDRAAAEPQTTAVATSAAEVLMRHGVFKGAEGLERLAQCQEFWDKQPYGTRLYFGDGIADYLHRDVLSTAVAALKAGANAQAGKKEAGAQPAPRHPAMDREYSREPLKGLYEAWNALPPCSLLGVIGSAIQELQAHMDGNGTLPPAEKPKAQAGAPVVQPQAAKPAGTPATESDAEKLRTASVALGRATVTWSELDGMLSQTFPTSGVQRLKLKEGVDYLTKAVQALNASGNLVSAARRASDFLDQAAIVWRDLDTMLYGWFAVLGKVRQKHVSVLDGLAEASAALNAIGAVRANDTDRLAAQFELATGQSGVIVRGLVAEKGVDAAMRELNEERELDLRLGAWVIANDSEKGFWVNGFGWCTNRIAATGYSERDVEELGPKLAAQFGSYSRFVKFAEAFDYDPDAEY